MKKRNGIRTLAVTLALTLALAPAASAITVEEARDLLRENYIDPIPEEILSLPTIQEITDALGDPYTYYMSAEEYQEFTTGINDTTVVGIGVMVEKLSDGIQVIQVAPEGPAAQGGLQLGDVIVGVDGTAIQEVGSPDALAQLITGEEGTQVTLTFRRDGEEMELTLTRAKVVFPVVTGQVVDGHIGWITATSFGENTGSYFETYLTEEDDQADRWVVDLRGNPGGYAVAVIEAAGCLVGNQAVAHVVDNQQEYTSWRISPFPVEIPPLNDEPLIVLTDGDSASASELFAAAMRDYDRALLIGTQTFGKGIAQDVFEQEDGSAMKITTQRYYSPRWATPDRAGVLPHLVVDPDLADEVALLLCGEEAGGTEVLRLELAGRDWYVHRSQATDPDHVPAFAELLAALGPNVPMTLNGAAVTPAQVAERWGVEYQSRWFDDAADSPYASEINTLAALGLLRGDEKGNFSPKGELTRAQLAAFLNQAMGYWYWESQGEAPYTDVEEEDWFAVAASSLYHLDIMQGDGAGRFVPNAPIDYEQFLTVLLRCGAWTDMTLQERMDTITLTDRYAEQPALMGFHLWAQKAVAVAASEDLSWEGGYQGDYGLLLRPLEEIEPNAVVTREEVAAMLYNLLSYSYLIP